MQRTSTIWGLRIAVMVFAFASLSLISTYADPIPVIYNFSGSSTSTGLSYSFQYTAPTFVTTSTLLSASSLDQCSISGGDTCIQVWFRPAGTWYDHYDVIGINSGYMLSYFYFGEGIFSIVGTHTAAAIQDIHPATLTVASSTPVPEPGTLVLVGSGLALAVWRKWRH